MKTNKTEKPTHTPGPWRISTGGSQGFNIMGPDQKRCAYVHWTNDHAKNDANARLIAAAPMMYDALIIALEELEEAAARADSFGDTNKEHYFAASGAVAVAILRARGH